MAISKRDCKSPWPAEPHGQRGWRKKWSSILPRASPRWLALPCQQGPCDLHAWRRQHGSFPGLSLSHHCSALTFGKMMSSLLLCSAVRPRLCSAYGHAGVLCWQCPDTLLWVCCMSVSIQTLSLPRMLKLIKVRELLCPLVFTQSKQQYRQHLLGIRSNFPGSNELHPQ